MNSLRFLGLTVCLLATPAWCQPPEYLHYDFDASLPGPPVSIFNLAVPGVGNPTPALNANQSLVPGTLCAAPMDTALQSNNVTSNWITTGWNCTLGSTAWSVGCKLDLSAGLVGGLPTANFFQYVFGCSSAGTFRCFVDGIAGNGNIILRGPIADVIIPGGGNQNAPVHVAWVYDPTLANIVGYLNGTAVVTVAQAPQNINGTASFVVGGYDAAAASSMQVGVRMDDFRFAGRAMTQTEILAWSTCSIGTATPTVQVNQPAAALSIDGNNSGTGFTVGSVAKCVGEAGVLDLASNLPGMTPFDVGITVGPAANPGYLATSEILNLNILIGDAFWLSTGTPAPLIPWPPLSWPGVPLALPFAAPPAAVTVHTQAYWANPGSPAGFSLSAPINLVTTPGLTVAAGDDTTTNVQIASLCAGAPTSIVYYGVTYTDFFVNSNGTVSFGGGDTAFTPSAATFLTGVPRIGNWTDYNPAAGGSIIVNRDPSKITVRWNNVVYFGTATPNVLQIEFGIGGDMSIAAYMPGAGGASSLLGFSPGLSAPGAVGVPVNWLSLMGMPPAVGVATNAVYELNPTTNVTGGFMSIVSPGSDGATYFVL